MQPRTFLLSLPLLALAAIPAALIACSGSGDQATASAGSGASASGAGGAGGGFGGGFTGSGGGGGGTSCTPPDMLIVLDRTMSMHREPNGTPALDTPAGHEQSKWYIAITAIEGVTAALQSGIRFGLELFPRDPGGNQCVTLSQRINGTTATNTQCEEGEILVMPSLDTAAMIDGLLDPETTRLCRSTPIGAGMTTAKTTLASIVTPDRPQYALLITDGQDTCDAALPRAEVQALAKAGVKTYVVGFDANSGGLDPVQLNDLACAGQTAAGFPAPCVNDGNGNYTWDPAGPSPVYLVAEDAAGLVNALTGAAASVCCDCVE